ncbi:hypothetical protein [Thalassotalea atypica]|uniref:hypothetical protein n=1 Tax=Thalassotalea atypica TaxID=2054316 RepID=UPI0025736569|nr:hypothetical protein [Thalassotalea atypica]
MLIAIAFYLIFLGQIGLISIYYPHKFTRRIQYVTNNFSPNEYPKLYPESIDTIHLKRKIYLGLNYIIAILGLVLLVVTMPLNAVENVDYQRIDSMPLIFGMVQFIPVLLLEISSFKQFKLMRAANTSTNKTADLTPRRLFDYISPLLLSFTAILIISCILFELYINEYTLTDDVISKIVALVLCNGLFIFLTYKNLHGKKLDPYQANTDRSKQTRTAIQSMVFVSILVSIFFMATAIINRFDFIELEVFVNSLYFQFISIFGFGSLLRALPIEELNFDVYKAEKVMN